MTAFQAGLRELRNTIPMRNSPPTLEITTTYYYMAIIQKTVRWAGAALCIAAMLASCGEKDPLTEEPSWLGSSIYAQLQSYGNYGYTLRLIDDLGQKAVLSQTGSKTLFVASDDVYDNFFRSNDWGVGRYEDLSMGQKKLLLNSAMVNNAYLVELLSNVSGPTPLVGQCMRRETAASVFDSVARILPQDMPDTKYWERYKKMPNGIVLLRDNTTKPMIHFLPAFMQQNKITDDDLAILTNGESNSTADAWVNGKKIIERDITCKNGYIQKLDGLATASDNMMAIIHNTPDMSRFASLIDRFCAPYYDDAATKEYNRLTGSADSVYTLKYFSMNSNTKDYGASEGGELTIDPDGRTVDAYLNYDPGWNQYIYSNTTGKDLHYDAGAMLVPSNAALDAWWQGGGKVLSDIYHTWENVPVKVLVKMLDINLIRAFTETVPSKFENILDNTTKLPLGIKKEDIDKCFIGCNGVVYMTNNMFTPAAYASVSFPALVNEETMNIIYWAIEKLSFEPYLNSMDSKYSFIIPTNEALKHYIDPCTYAQSTAVEYEFYFDNDRKTVGAHRYNYDMANHQRLEGELNDASAAQVENRLRDLLDNLIIVGNVEDGHTYYTTKGGSIVRVSKGRYGEKTMTFEGGLQMENGTKVTVDNIYDEQNGKSYVVNACPPLTSARSLYSLLSGRDGCGVFFDLLSKGGSANTLLKARTGGFTCADYNCSLFDAYNYTVYVPTDASIRELHDKGWLPYWSDYEALTADDFGGDATKLKAARKIVADRILNFMKYHIQDNATFIDGEPVAGLQYETSTLNPKTKRFYSVTVSADATSLSVRDQLGTTRHVLTSADHNMVGREYWLQDADKLNKNIIYNASDVVVHQIDGPLLYIDTQKTSWQAEVDALK